MPNPKFEEIIQRFKTIYDEHENLLSENYPVTFMTIDEVTENANFLLPAYYTNAYEKEFESISRHMGVTHKALNNFINQIKPEKKSEKKESNSSEKVDKKTGELAKSIQQALGKLNKELESLKDKIPEDFVKNPLYQEPSIHSEKSQKEEDLNKSETQSEDDDNNNNDDQENVQLNLEPSESESQLLKSMESRPVPKLALEKEREAVEANVKKIPKLPHYIRYAQMKESYKDSQKRPKPQGKFSERLMKCARKIDPHGKELLIFTALIEAKYKELQESVKKLKKTKKIGHSRQFNNEVNNALDRAQQNLEQARREKEEAERQEDAQASQSQEGEQTQGQNQNDNSNVNNNNNDNENSTGDLPQVEISNENLNASNNAEADTASHPEDNSTRGRFKEVWDVFIQITAILSIYMKDNEIRVEYEEKINAVIKGAFGRETFQKFISIRQQVTYRDNGEVQEIYESLEESVVLICGVCDLSKYWKTSTQNFEKYYACFFKAHKYSTGQKKQMKRVMINLEKACTVYKDLEPKIRIFMKKKTFIYKRAQGKLKSPFKKVSRRYKEIMQKQEAWCKFAEIYCVQDTYQKFSRVIINNIGVIRDRFATSVRLLENDIFELADLDSFEGIKKNLKRIKKNAETTIGYFENDLSANETVPPFLPKDPYYFSQKNLIKFGFVIVGSCIVPSLLECFAKKKSEGKKDGSGKMQKQKDELERIEEDAQKLLTFTVQVFTAMEDLVELTDKISKVNITTWKAVLDSIGMVTRFMILFSAIALGMLSPIGMPLLNATNMAMALGAQMAGGGGDDDGE